LVLGGGRGERLVLLRSRDSAVHRRHGSTGATTCCIDGGTAECDRPGDLGAALAALSALAAARGQVAAYDIVGELSQGHPVGVRYAWDSGGAHVFTLIAADDGTDMVRAADPAYGLGDFSMSDLQSNYRNFAGTWTHTYLTKPIAALGRLWAPATVPFVPYPSATRLGVRTGAKAVRVQIYDLGTNELRAGAELKNASATRYDVVIDGERSVEQPRDKGLRKTGAWEDHHDYRTAFAMLDTLDDAQGVRLLRIPGLYVFALWTSRRGGGRVVPVPPVPRFLEPRPYSEAEFLTIVRRRAEEIAQKEGSDGKDFAP